MKISLKKLFLTSGMLLAFGAMFIGCGGDIPEPPADETVTEETTDTSTDESSDAEDSDEKSDDKSDDKSEDPEYIGKPVTSRAELMEMGFELASDIQAFVNDFAKDMEPTKRAAATPADPTVKALVEFLKNIILIDSDPDAEQPFQVMPLDENGVFELKGKSLNLTNITVDQLIEAYKQLTGDLWNVFGEGCYLEMFADALGMTAEELIAEANKYVSVEKFKYSGDLTVKPTQEAEVDEPFDGIGDSRFYVNNYVLTTLDDVNEEVAIKIQNINDALKVALPEAKTFPVNNISVNEAIEGTAYLELPLGSHMVGGMNMSDPEYETKKAEFINNFESARLGRESNEFDGSVNASVDFDFVTSKSNYTGELSVVLNTGMTTALLQEILSHIDDEDAPLDLIKEVGTVTVTATNNGKTTYTETIDLAELYTIIDSSME